MASQRTYFSIVYQITQRCLFDCPICLRYHDDDSLPLSSQERRLMVGNLAARGLGRICVTGGEPTVLGSELFEFLRYIHNRRIHTCLSTTGFRLTKRDIIEMDDYLDQMLLSVRAFTPGQWEAEFGNGKYAAEMVETAKKILAYIKDTGIIVEVNTVAHKKNIEDLVALGETIANINSDLIWRIDEYYGTGIKCRNRNKFELSSQEFNEMRKRLLKIFGGRFQDMRFVKKEERAASPEYFISQNGELYKTAEFLHTQTGLNAALGNLPSDFQMLRPWEEHQKVCRNFGWDD